MERITSKTSVHIDISEADVLQCVSEPVLVGTLASWATVPRLEDPVDLKAVWFTSRGLTCFVDVRIE